MFTLDTKLHWMQFTLHRFTFLTKSHFENRTFKLVLMWCNLTTAVDVNECATNNGGCQQLCGNTVGSFQCSCTAGYNLASNGLSCTGNLSNEKMLKWEILMKCLFLDINECTANTHNCLGTCTNIQGSFTCGCSGGFQLAADGRSCNDINECTAGTHNCQSTCSNTQGSFTCGCQTGFQLASDGITCVDINECANSANNNCQQICTNSPGGFMCSCMNGFSMNADQATCASQWTL